MKNRGDFLQGQSGKWKEGDRWYNLDQFGYEALAKAFTSALLERSSIERDTPFTFVRYRMERMNVHGHIRTGYINESFLRAGESIVTLNHLYRRFLDKPLREVLAHLPSDKKRIAYLVEMAAEMTGFELFPQYLTLRFCCSGLETKEILKFEADAVGTIDGWAFSLCCSSFQE